MISRLYLAWIVIALTVGGCGKSEKGGPSENATTGSFELVADEVLKPVIDSLVTGFMSENPLAKVTVKYVSAGEAVRELLNKQARAIIIDRALTPQERAAAALDSVSLPALAIAADGIGCIVSKNNPLAAIRMSDLRKIISGEMKSWSEMAKPIVEPGDRINGTITKIFPAYPSSIEFQLDSILMGPAKLTGGQDTRFASADSTFRAVAQDAGAIGFVGSAWIHWFSAHGDSGTKVLPIIPADSSSRGVTEPILLHMAYVYEGLYPLVTPVNGYSTEGLNTVPRGFLSYAMTAHGQVVFKNFDVLPKTQIIHLVAQKP